MASDADKWLMGEYRDPVISWAEVPIGHTVKGKIVKPSDYVQKRDDEGNLEYWDDEKAAPKMQLVVHLDTGEIKDDHEDHKGVWRLFVSSKGMRDAIRDAVKAAKAKALAVGGVLSVTYTGKGEKRPNAPKTFSAPKLFKAVYAAPPDASQFALDFGHSEASAFTGTSGSINVTGQRNTRTVLVSSDEPPF